MSASVGFGLGAWEYFVGRSFFSPWSLAGASKFGRPGSCRLGTWGPLGPSGLQCGSWDASRSLHDSVACKTNLKHKKGPLPTAGWASEALWDPRFR